MRPPLFFDSVKEPLQRGFSCRCGAIHLQSPPRPVEKKTFGRKTALCALFAYDTGGPARDLGRSNRCQRWARALVLAISISLASGLRRKLAHSDARPLPTKTASLGFRGGPGFAETFRPSARDGLPSCGVGCKTDLTCVFPPLPLCRPRIGLPAANPVAPSDCARRRVPEPTAAKRRHLGVGSGERGKRRIIHSMTTPKAAPTPPNAEKHLLCSSGPKSTPVPALKFLPDRPHRPPFCPNLTAGKDLGPSGFSFRRAAARCFGAQPTRSGGS